MGYKETVWEMEDTDVQWERAAEYFRAYTGVSISDIPEKFSAYVFPMREVVRKQGRLIMKYDYTEVKGRTEEYILLDKGELFTGKQIVRAFRDASRIVLFAASMVNIDELLAAHPDMMEFFFLEYWAVSALSVFREELIRRLNGELIKTSLKQTGVWSPGQSGFELKNQIPLFALLKPETIGITLDKHQRMLPLKSISGAIGLVPENCEIILQPCDYCSFGKTCPGYSGEKYKDCADRRLI